MGKLVIENIAWGGLTETRTVRIYLPEGYGEEDKRYPVLYMHDGQNVFSDKTAAYGMSWGYCELLDELERKSGKGLIVVALDNCEKRLTEYGPWGSDLPQDVPLPQDDRGGMGKEYARLFAEVLVPYIDRGYLTDARRESRFVAGSSMGGIISAYIIDTYPQVFSKAGIFSLASWFSLEEFNNFIAGHTAQPPREYYVYVGTAEASLDGHPELPQAYIDCSIDYARMMMLGGTPARDVILRVGVDEQHNELAWRRHSPDFLAWLIGE